MNQQQLQRAAEQIREHLNSVGYDLGPDTVNLIRQVLTVEQKRAGAEWMAGEGDRLREEVPKWFKDQVVILQRPARTVENHFPAGHQFFIRQVEDDEGWMRLEDVYGKGLTLSPDNLNTDLKPFNYDLAAELERLKGERDSLRIAAEALLNGLSKEHSGGKAIPRSIHVILKIKALKEVLAPKPQTEHGEGERQWISVKDRLPENDGVYYCICEDEPALMMITDGKIRQVRFCNGGVYIADYVPKDYTYWTPKPKTEQP